MTWHHLRAAPPDRGARILDDARLGDLLPGVGVLETNFEVPGHGRQAAIAADAEGRPLLVETAHDTVAALPTGLFERLAWFDAHRTLLPRLFGDRVRADLQAHAIVLAPAFGASLARSLPLGGTLHLFRVRALAGAEGDRFALVEPLAGTGGDAGDAVHPFLDPSFAPGRVHAPTPPAATAPEAARPTPSSASERSVASFRPRRRSTPDELLRRARTWLEKLSPDITTRATGDRTRFLFHDETLVDAVVTGERLELDVPEHGRLSATDSHELNACMQQVITRYFALVGSDDVKLSRLRREDILTERELAEFVPPPPDQ